MAATLLLLFAVFGYTYGGYVGLALGGYGASNFIELVTNNSICKAQDVSPPLPVIPAANPTWVAEYVDEQIYLCGGQVIQ